MQHRGVLCLLLAAVALLGCRTVGADPCLDEQAMWDVIDGALDHLQDLADRRERPDGSGGGEGPTPLVASLFPNSTDRSTGLYQGSKASKWTAGFLAGCYWRAYNLTGDAKWARLATAELPGLAKVAGETDNHKVSHIFDSAYSEALAAGAPGADPKKYQKVLQRAAASLAARYNPKVKAIQSWNDIGDPEYEVIIDSTASLKIMWEAAKLPGGKQEWADIALQHMRTVTKELFREDGSTIHVVQFDPDTGAVVLKRTHQGYSDDSTWSRGQAWAIVGYTHAYDATRDPELLATAQVASDYFLKRLAEADDGVPLWDFDLPADSKQPWKDTSAAAIAASGLVRLGQLTNSQNYTDAAAALVAALADNYLGWEGPQPVEALLRNGTFSVPGGHHSTGLIWGDWYFLDALSQLLPVANATCAQ